MIQIISENIIILLRSSSWRRLLRAGGSNDANRGEVRRSSGSRRIAAQAAAVNAHLPISAVMLRDKPTCTSPGSKQRFPSAAIAQHKHFGGFPLRRNSPPRRYFAGIGGSPMNASNPGIMVQDIVRLHARPAASRRPRRRTQAGCPRTRSALRRNPRSRSSSVSDDSAFVADAPTIPSPFSCAPRDDRPSGCPPGNGPSHIRFAQTPRNVGIDRDHRNALLGRLVHHPRKIGPVHALMMIPSTLEAIAISTC